MNISEIKEDVYYPWYYSTCTITASVYLFCIKWQRCIKDVGEATIASLVNAVWPQSPDLREPFHHMISTIWDGADL